MKNSAQRALQLARWQLFGGAVLAGAAFSSLYRTPFDSSIKLFAGLALACIVISIDFLVAYLNWAITDRHIQEPSQHESASEDTQSKTEHKAVKLQKTGSPLLLAVGLAMFSETVVLGQGAPFVGAVVFKQVLTLLITIALLQI